MFRCYLSAYSVSSHSYLYNKILVEAFGICFDFSLLTIDSIYTHYNKFPITSYMTYSTRANKENASNIKANEITDSEEKYSIGNLPSSETSVLSNYPYIAEKLQAYGCLPPTPSFFSKSNGIAPSCL